MTVRKLALALLAAGLGFATVACSGNNGTESSTSDGTNLNEPYGGYTAADEAAAFGDAELARVMGAEPSFDDPLFPALAVDSIDDGHRDVYALALRWGQLEGDSTNTTLTDWSGSLELLRGGIVVRRLIRFEPGRDHIVRPRSSRQLLEWVSKTSVHFDGLLLLIYDPPVDDDTVPPPPNQLVLTMPQYSRTFSMDELANLSEIVDIDALGNQLAINARKLDQIACGSGPLEGIWRLNPSGKNGEFFGRWMTEDGVFRGHLRGHFGNRPEGHRVFFGKVIGVDGHFAGRLNGTWGFSDADSSMGWFEGTWDGREGHADGTVEGQWQSAAPDGNGDDDDDGQFPGHGRGHNRNARWGGGFFSGFWERPCDADSTDTGA